MKSVIKTVYELIHGNILTEMVEPKKISINNESYINSLPPLQKGFTYGSFPGKVNAFDIYNLKRELAKESKYLEYRLTEREEIVALNKFAEDANRLHIFIIDEKNSKLAGMCLMSVRVEDDNSIGGYINKIGVLKKYRGLGLSSALIDSAKQITKLNGGKIIRLAVDIENENAINVYRHKKFKVITEYKCYEMEAKI